MLDNVSIKLDQEVKVLPADSSSLLPIEATSIPNLPNIEEEAFADNLGFILINYPDLKPETLQLIGKIWDKWSTPADNGIKFKLLKGLSTAGIEEFWQYWEKGLAMLPSREDYVYKPAYAYCRNLKYISSQTVQGHAVSDYMSLLDSDMLLSTTQQKVEQILQDNNFISDPRLKSNVIFFGLNKLLHPELRIIVRLLKGGRDVNNLFIDTMERSVNLAWEIAGHRHPMSPKDKVMVFETLADTNDFSDAIEAFSKS